MNRSVLIVSLARCGSSAIYEFVKQSLGKDCEGFFEPNYESFLKHTIPALDQGKNVCVKVLLRPFLQFNTNFQERFTQVVGLVRDPRDNLISRLLFRMVSPAFIENKKVYDVLLPLFEQKLDDPNSISVCKLFRQMEKTGLMEPMIDQRVEENLSFFINWHAKSLDPIIYKYEKFIQEQYDEIFCVTNQKRSISKSEIQTVYPQIKRAGKIGDWRHWFTSEDIDFFRPRFEEYMTVYNYCDDWNLQNNQFISAETSIDYIRKYARL